MIILWFILSLIYIKLAIRVDNGKLHPLIFGMLFFPVASILLITLIEKY